MECGLLYFVVNKLLEIHIYYFGISMAYVFEFVGLFLCWCCKNQRHPVSAVLCYELILQYILLVFVVTDISRVIVLKHQLAVTTFWPCYRHYLKSGIITRNHGIYSVLFAVGIAV